MERTPEKPRAIAAVPSVEPSSTTMTSKSRKVCASTERIARARNASALYAGMMTLTAGIGPRELRRTGGVEPLPCAGRGGHRRRDEELERDSGVHEPVEEWAPLRGEVRAVVAVHPVVERVVEAQTPVASA